MRLLVAGGTGVLGRALRPLAEVAGHEFAVPRREELDLFDPPRSPTPCAASMACCTWRPGSVRSSRSRIRTQRLP